MTQRCIVSGQKFSVSEAEKAFYAKQDLPIPRISPIERWRRRMTWRNDRTFWKRKCDLSGEMFISSYPPEAKAPVYKPSEWWSDKWNPLDYGQDFDFDRPFFGQWAELMHRVPRLGIDIVNCENSDYCNYCGDAKNCYLDIAGEGNEDCYFNLFTKHSTNCVDCTFVYNSELCYECINSHNAYECFFSMNLENCSDCAFSFDLKGCKNCLFSSNLRQQEYCIFNEKLTREAYEKQKAELNLGSHKHMEHYRAQWLDVMQNATHRDMVILNSENCTGNEINSSKNTAFSFNVNNCEDCGFCYDVLDAKDCYDLNYSLYKPEASCELISTLSMSYSAYCMASHYCGNCFYTDQCNNSQDLFGCIGLGQKKFCILNKQYTEEAYKELKNKIIEHMKQTGEWGHFFPEKYSPWAYNQTVAQEYLPLTQEQAEARGCRWNLEERGSVEGAEQGSSELPDSIAEADNSILKQSLVCEDSGKSYRIIAQELKFYQKTGLAIPRLCPDSRHLQRMNIRPPRTLCSRNCDTCNKQTLSPYKPDRPEKVVCEACFLNVVN